MSIPSSVFSISLPLFFGANIPCLKPSSAASRLFKFSSNSVLSMYPRYSAAAIPAIRPSIIAELASSIPETSPATNTPGIEVLPFSSHIGTCPPRFGLSSILQPDILRSCDIGESPTARHIVSTSKCFSVPGMNLKDESTSAIVTPVTWSSPSAFTIVCDR